MSSDPFVLTGRTAVVAGAYGDLGAAIARALDASGVRVAIAGRDRVKLDSLAKAGIEISGRMPLETPVTADNRRYLPAKAARAGHHLGQVLAALSEPPKSLKNPAPLAS